MDYLEARFKRAGVAAVTMLICGLLASELFSLAGKTHVPMNSDDLLSIKLQIDEVSSGSGRPVPENILQRNEAPPPWWFSNDYPNVPFELYGAARGVSVQAPEQVELLVNRDPAKLVATQEQRAASLSIPVVVYGVRKDGELVANPQYAYETALGVRARYTLLAWIAMGGALAAAAFIALTIRSVLQENYR